MDRRLTEDRAETEFDDLLDRLTNQLALTPMGQPDADLESIPEPRPRPDSVHDVASAAEPQPARARGIDPMVKIVGILTGSITAVAVAALVVFGGAQTSAVAASGGTEAEADALVVGAPGGVEQPSVGAEQLADADTAQVAPPAAEPADDQAGAAAELAVAASDDELLQRVEPQTATPPKKAKAKQNRKRKRRASKRTTPAPGSDFDAL